MEVEGHEEGSLRGEGLEVGLVGDSVGSGGDGVGEVGLRGREGGEKERVWVSFVENVDHQTSGADTVDHWLQAELRKRALRGEEDEVLTIT